MKLVNNEVSMLLKVATCLCYTAPVIDGYGAPAEW